MDLPSARTGRRARACEHAGGSRGTHAGPRAAHECRRGGRAFVARGGLHDDGKLLDARLLVVGHRQLEPELERRELVRQNLHDLVRVVGQVILRQLQYLILRPVDGHSQDSAHPGHADRPTTLRRDPGPPCSYARRVMTLIFPSLFAQKIHPWQGLAFPFFKLT